MKMKYKYTATIYDKNGYVSQIIVDSRYDRLNKLFILNKQMAKEYVEKYILKENQFVTIC